MQKGKSAYFLSSEGSLLVQSRIQLLQGHGYGKACLCFAFAFQALQSPRTQGTKHRFGLSDFGSVKRNIRDQLLRGNQ